MMQQVRSVDVPGQNEASACESMIDSGTFNPIKLAAVCENPSSCHLRAISVVDSSSVVRSIPVISPPAANPTA